MKARVSLTLFLLNLCLAHAHHYSEGKCPSFTPMKNFDWKKVKIQYKLYSLDHIAKLSHSLICSIAKQSLAGVDFSLSFRLQTTQTPITFQPFNFSALKKLFSLSTSHSPTRPSSCPPTCLPVRLQNFETTSKSI